MATLQEIINGLLGTSTTTRLPDDVRQALGSPPTSETPITDLVNSLKEKRQSPRTGTRAVSRDSLGVIRPTSEAPYGPALPPQPLNLFGGMQLNPNEFTKARIALNRAQNPQKPDEFTGVNTPLPFGPNYNRPQVTDQDNVYGELGIGEQNVATRPPVVPLPPYSEPDMEEVNADNLMLAQLASPTTPDGTPKDPGKFASDRVTYNAAKGIAAGRDNAEYNNQKSLLSDTADSISGLLGDFDFKGLLRVFARPEFLAPMPPGVSPIFNFVNAAAADRRARAAQRQAAGESALEMYKAKTDRLKAQQTDPSKLPKLNSQAVDLTTGIQANKTLINLGNQIKTILTKDIATTGGPGSVGQAVEAIGAAFGFSPEEGAGSSAKEINDYVARMRLHILGTGVFGREANKQELALLNSILPESGFWTSRERIRRNIDAAMKSAEELMAIKNNLLIQSGYKSFDEMTKQSWRRGM